MLTITIDEEVQARFQAVAAPEEGFAAFVAAATQAAIARREWQAKGRAEMQAMLDGLKSLFDPKAPYQRYREMYGWEDLSHLSREELQQQAEALFDSLPSEQAAPARHREAV